MEFKVKVKSGKGEYYKDIQDLYFELDGKEVKFQDLYEKVKALEIKCSELEKELSKEDDEHKRIETVLTGAIELLQKKVSRIEAEIKEA